MNCKRILSKIFVALVIVLLYPVSVFAFDSPIIMDNADLLTPEAESLLWDDMKPVLEYGGVAFVTNEASYGGMASDYANRLCYDFFSGESGVVFLIDMYNRRIEIFSTGDIYKTLGTMWANSITDNIYTYATEGEYYTCAKQCFSQILTVLQGGRLSVPMRYVSSILLSVGLVLIFLYWLLYTKTSSSLLGKNIKSIVNRNDCTSENLILIDKIMTSESRVRHSSSSSGGGRSGGGGGGHSGGGGGHSGGGGGHGF